MLINNNLLLALKLFLALNAAIAVLFWLHEKLEKRAHSRLKTAVEKAVRAVEQLCATLESSEKKRQAVLRAQALLGWYRWVMPALVIDTAIEAEIYILKQLHAQLSVDHDTHEELVKSGARD
ncbi:MAG TPA: hypothetical protein DEA44_05265 [Firmicutes bacterium]|nr:hypothetical protein [Bacillota bacterium]